MTYSIVGADPEAGEVGVAVQSKFLAVGAIVPWARGGVGAVAVQAYPDVTTGARALDLLAEGEDPTAVLRTVVAADERADERQVGVVAADGRSASHTGAACFDHAGSRTGPGYAAQGNVLTSPQVLDALAGTFAEGTGRLAVRLLDALRAGQDAGGERRGMESAALMVCRPGGGYGGNHDRYLDLRVDHADDPIAGLRDLLVVHDHLVLPTPRAEWLPLDEELRDEIRGELVAAGWLERGADDAAVTRQLEQWLGWENLEERWLGPMWLDPVVLGHLRGGR